MRLDIKNFITSLKEFYRNMESINFKFPEYYEELMQEYFEPIKIQIKIGEGIFPIIERITVNKRVINQNIRIDEADKLKYPPSECVKNYGRANLKKQSVFYGTFNFITAIKEMKPEKGDLITVSRWTLKIENDPLIICPMFLRQPKDGSTNVRLLNIYNSFIIDLQKLPPSVSELFFEIHKFYSDCFAREIDKADNQGYIVTALLADKILNQYKNGIVDAIIYPSSKEDLRTENIVIKKESFDKKYLLSETVEKKLLDFSEHGDRYVFELLGKSSKIEDNRILWN